MSSEKQQEDHIVDDDLLKVTYPTVLSIDNEGLIKTNNVTNLHPTIDESSKSVQNQTSINKKSLSLVLSLRIHDQHSLQNRPQSINIPAFPLTSLSLKPYNTPLETSHLLSNNNQPVITSFDERTLIDEHISHSLNIPAPTTLATSFIYRVTPNITTTEVQKDEIHRDVPLIIDMEDSIPISAKQLEAIERGKHRHKIQREIITIAKKAIKFSYQKRRITKDDYKTIMKKVVTKATYSNRVNQEWISKKIHSYVKKCRTEQ